MTTPARDASALCLIRALEKERGVRWYWTKSGFPKRAFQSQTDAQAFDNGWDLFDPMQPIPEQWGPFRDGWLAASADEDERLFAKSDAADERIED